MMPFVDQKIGTAVLFVQPGQENFLFMAQGGDDKQRPLAVSIQFGAFLESQNHHYRIDPAAVADAETIAVELHGEQASFEVGKAKIGSREVWQAQGDFAGKNRTRDAGATARRRPIQQGRRDRRAQVVEVGYVF